MEETKNLNDKSLKLLFAALVFFNVLQAQWAIQGAYVNSKIGTGGINLMASKVFSRHQIGLGLRLNLYSLAHKDDQNSVYTRRLYPIDFYQNFGLGGFYSYNLTPSLVPVRISAFTDVQITHAPTRNRGFLPAYTLPDGQILYTEFVERFGPFLWLENTFGLSIEVPIYRNVTLINKYGFGLMSIFGDKLYASQNTAVLLGSWYEWELTYTVQLGLSYTFKK